MAIDPTYEDSNRRTPLAPVRQAIYPAFVHVKVPRQPPLPISNPRQPPSRLPRAAARASSNRL